MKARGVDLRLFNILAEEYSVLIVSCWDSGVKGCF